MAYPVSCPRPICRPTATPAPASVYFKDNDGNLQQLEEHQASCVLQAAAQGQRYVNLGYECWWRRSRLGLLDATASCDLERMKHINATTGEEEDIIIEVSWNAPLMQAMVDRDGSLRRQVLVMALHRIRHTPLLQKILAHKGLNVSTDKIRENPYIRTGHLPFENFLQSLLAYTTSRDILYGHILETASDRESQLVSEHYRALENDGFHVVYHGTRPDVMDAILEQGLRPEYRRGHNADYFGRTHDVSRSYSDAGSGCKLLVFFILGGLSSCAVTTVSSSNDELPIAEVTLPY